MQPCAINITNSTNTSPVLGDFTMFSQLLHIYRCITDDFWCVLFILLKLCLFFLLSFLWDKDKFHVVMENRIHFYSICCQMIVKTLWNSYQKLHVGWFLSNSLHCSFLWRQLRICYYLLPLEFKLHFFSPSWKWKQASPNIWCLKGRRPPSRLTQTQTGRSEVC